MHRLKIVHVVESFAGGTLSFINTLVSGMPECEHWVIHGERSEELSAADAKKKFPEGVNFISWSATRNPSVFRDLSSLFELKRYFTEVKPDAIHLHSSKAGFLGRWAAWASGMANKVVYTPNALSFLRTDIPSWQKEIFAALERCASVLGSTTFACGNSEYLSMKARGIAGNVINNSSLNITALVQEKPAPVSPKGSQKLRVVTLGRITEQKNPFRFNSIALAFEGYEDIEFVWIGDGELKQVLISSNLRITGWLPANRVIEELRAGDIYLSTSDWEGMPLSVIEAMACQKPLLLFDCVGNRDAVDEGKNGYLFSTEERAISILKFWLSNRNELPLLGLASYQRAIQEFSPAKMIEAYKNQYQEVSEGPAPSLKYD